MCLYWEPIVWEGDRLERSRFSGRRRRQASSCPPLQGKKPAAAKSRMAGEGSPAILLLLPSSIPSGQTFPVFRKTGNGRSRFTGRFRATPAGHSTAYFLLPANDPPYLIVCPARIFATRRGGPPDGKRPEREEEEQKEPAGKEKGRKNFFPAVPEGIKWRQGRKAWGMLCGFSVKSGKRLDAFG